MKNSVKLILMAFASLCMTTCKQDKAYLITYPNSFPVIDQAQVAESVITYGDSITLSVSVSDKITPLSTLEIQVVVNNEVVTTESIRTKGNQSAVTRRYSVPFVADRPDNADLKVYISSINVDGWTTDTILNTTKAKRPVINGIWLVPNTLGGRTTKLNLIDTANLIYYAKGMTFGNTVSYYLATKVDKFKRIDWSGLVFGKVGDGIGLINQVSDSITSSDPTLVGISEITFDALHFTVTPGGKLLQPVTTLDINTDLAPTILGTANFMGGNVYFGEGVDVTFTGLTNLQNQLPPDYFNITGANTATFLGKTGLYKADYYGAGGYLYIEPQWTAVYPDVLWICGTGFGRPSTPYGVTASWNWNSPLDYAPCRLISPGVFQVTIYGSNKALSAPNDAYGSFDFKFFFQHTWPPSDHPEYQVLANTYTVTPTPFFGRSDPGNVGNVNGGPTTFAGVYRITVDMNAKTINLLKTN